MWGNEEYERTRRALDDACNEVWRRGPAQVRDLLRGETILLLWDFQVASVTSGPRVVATASARHFTPKALTGILAHELAHHILSSSSNPPEVDYMEREADRIAACDWGFLDEVLAFHKEYESLRQRSDWPALGRKPPSCD